MKKDNHEKIYDILLEMRGEMGEMKSDIKSTLAQATKTNGRVNTLEAIINNWKGRLAVVLIVGTFIFNIFWTYIKKEIGL